MTQAESIRIFLETYGQVALKDIYLFFPEYPKSSVRRAVYGLRDKGAVERISRGVYDILTEERKREIEHEGELRIEDEESYARRGRIMYHFALSIRFVEYHEYFDITIHFYTSYRSEIDDRIRKEMIDLIYDEWSKKTGYKSNEIWYEEPRQETDIEEEDRDDELLRKRFDIDMEEL